VLPSWSASAYGIFMTLLTAMAPPMDVLRPAKVLSAKGHLGEGSRIQMFDLVLDHVTQPHHADPSQNRRSPNDRSGLWSRFVQQHLPDAIRVTRLEPCHG
jgi:hypothetical protein